MKDIKGFEGKYAVTEDGKVWSYWGKGHFLKQSITQTGYCVVSLSKNGQYATHYVHRLVAETFIANPDRLPEINHKDEDKSNNSVTNLEWCDAQYNMTFGTRIERAVATRRKNHKGGY